MTYLYTDKTAVQNYLLKNINVSFDTQLTAWITAMSEFIDTQAGYPVFTDTETTKSYDGNGLNRLMISPVHTITEVLVDAVAPESTILLKTPYNNDVKTELVLKSGVFTPDYANVTVTGMHCLKATLQEQIKWACTVFVSGIVNQSDNQSEGVKSEKIGEYQVTFKDEQRQDFLTALNIVKALKPISF